MIAATIALTRWREHIPYVIPLTLLGAILGAQASMGSIDIRLLAITGANVFAVIYAFMINDIEDAPDDARDPSRAAKNVISSGQLGLRSGYLACQIVAIAALILYLAGGFYVFLIGVTTLLLSHFYSSPPVRLKAWPITDIVSHVLMLSTLILLAGFYTYSTRPGTIWWVIAATTFFSAYGQFYNQIRDYKMDKLAGLRNTAILVGKKKALQLMYLSMAIAVICIIGSIFSGLFPLWLLFVLICVVPIQRLFGKSKTGGHAKDSRGSEAFDVTGKYQNQLIFVFNVLILAWLLKIIFYG